MSNYIVIGILFYVIFIIVMAKSIKKLNAMVLAGFIILGATYGVAFFAGIKFSHSPFLGLFLGTIFMTALKIVIYRVFFIDLYSFEDIKLISLVSFALGYKGTMLFLLFATISVLIYQAIRMIDVNKVMPFKYLTLVSVILSTAVVLGW